MGNPKMKRMKRSAAWGMGFWAMLLAGCQPSGVELQVKEEVNAERVGLQITPIYDFVPEGVLATHPNQVGRAYAEAGELHFRVVRLTNTSEREIELYPDLPGGDDSRVSLEQRLVSFCPRSLPHCTLNLGETFPAAVNDPRELVVIYTADFRVSEATLSFSSGGVDALEKTNRWAIGKGARLRPGESAEIRVRLRLRDETPLLLPRTVDPRYVVEGFLPPDRVPGPGDLPDFLFEGFARAYLRAEFRYSLLVRNPDTGALHPVFLPGALLPPAEKSVGIPASYSIDDQMPTAAYRTQIPGLPVLR